MPNLTVPDTDVSGDTPVPAPATTSTRSVVSLIVAGAFALLGAAILSITLQSGKPAGDGWGGTVLSTPTERPSFTLQDTSGQPYDFLARTQGQYTVLIFGYVNCPDVCPMQLSTLAGALRQGPALRPTVVFVGVDSERDTPEALRNFLDSYDSRFVGLTGTAEQVRAAEQAAGLPPTTPLSVAADGTTLLGHGAQALLFTPDNRAHLAYPAGVRQQDWTDDLGRLARTNEWTTT